MTGKEAINILKEEKIYLSNYNTNEVLNAIEKDLLVLETLKEHLKNEIYGESPSIGFKMVLDLSLDKNIEDYMFVHDWWLGYETK